MAKQKFYVVWVGRKPGIYKSWDDCKTQISGFPGARYKSYRTLSEAEAAYNHGPEADLVGLFEAHSHLSDEERPIQDAIAVDAACAGNPGPMEYRGVYVASGTEVFRSKLHPNGTNNIGEFLALVHAVAWQQKKKLSLPIYSDSLLAIKWVFDGKAKTKLEQDGKNNELFELISRAEKWLTGNTIHVPILKWDTVNWGEVPADFGRK